MDNAVMELETKALSLPDQAKAIGSIVTPEQYAAAGELLVAIKDLRKGIAEHHAPMIEAAHRAHKEALAARKRLDDPLDQAERVVKPAMGSYVAEEERKRREVERVAQEAARKAEEDARLAEAEAAERAGDHAEADAMIQAPVVVPPVVVPSSVPKVAGVASVKVWKWRITNQALIPRQFFVLDETKINGVVRTMKNLAQIPGIEVYPEDEVRGARR